MSSVAVSVGSKQPHAQSFQRGCIREKYKGAIMYTSLTYLCKTEQEYIDYSRSQLRGSFCRIKRWWSHFASGGGAVSVPGQMSADAVALAGA